MTFVHVSAVAELKEGGDITGAIYLFWQLCPEPLDQGKEAQASWL